VRTGNDGVFPADAHRRRNPQARLDGLGQTRHAELAEPINATQSIINLMQSSFSCSAASVDEPQNLSRSVQKLRKGRIKDATK
jgi:hypothetical protein